MSGAACNVCGLHGAACPHHHDLNRAAAFSIFPPPVSFIHHEPPPAPAGALHEFHFFGHDVDGHESVAWLFDDPPPAVADRSPPADHRHRRSTLFHPFGYHPAGTDGLTLEVSLGRGELDAVLGLGGGGGRHTEPAASATIMSFCGSTFTDAASSTPKEAIMIEGEGSSQQPTAERQAKVMRYKEKRKRRRYKKQIRYASRKAYAEMRPRVKGRFAKVPEEADAPPPPSPSAYDPSRLDLGWFRS